MEGMIGEISMFFFNEMSAQDSPIGIGVTNDHLTNPPERGVTHDNSSIGGDGALSATATEYIISDDFLF